jgi:NADPH:quinone reductase-like Zn-dependent oxidoreductase
MSGRSGSRLYSTVTAAGQVEVALREEAVPAPAADEVLIQVEAAPINPSDLGLMLASGDPERARLDSAAGPVATLPLPDGALDALRERVGDPIPVGNEGAGTVIEAGSEAQALVGRVVAVAAGGMYSQFRVVDAGLCLPLPDGARATDGAASFVNPMTALAMVETMRDEGHRAIVHTAAASSLGHMLNRLCLAEGIPLVCVVRSSAHAASLREAGAVHVVDSGADGFEGELIEAIRATGATLAFDAIGGGGLADHILHAMERAIGDGAGYNRYGSTVHKQVYLYGMLDRGPTVLNRTYGMAWGIGGWLLPNTLARIGPQRTVGLRNKVAAGLKTTFATTFTDRIGLAGALDPEAIARYGRPRTGTKFLITPDA